MTIFQRRTVLAMILCMAFIVLYCVPYAALRMNGYFIRGEAVDYDTIMYAASASLSSGGAYYIDGDSRMWERGKHSHLPLYALRLYAPMIRTEIFLWTHYWKYRHIIP